MKSFYFVKEILSIINYIRLFDYDIDLDIENHGILLMVVLTTIDDLYYRNLPVALTPLYNDYQMKRIVLTAFLNGSLFFNSPCAGCQEIADEFRSQEIDGQALLLLKEDHLMSTMNIKLGPALKIFARISMLKDS